MASKTDSRPQFSLAALMGAVIVCSVIFGLLANMDTTYQVSIRCQTIPADDQGLADWFAGKDGVKDVVTFRDGSTVNVKYAKRHGTIELLTPPLADLGYTGLRVDIQSTVSSPSIVGGALIWVSKIPALIWFGIAALFTAVLIAKLIRLRQCTVPTNQIEVRAENDA